ncbi:MAG: hypothetical protein H6667_15145 [Ardenticatenaceae bacterium]|nr:hypothetical protein [Ardenticatenaceae bacterium]MCB9444524.1 hypothetical protein [Ardenticatenaceae bacterium]
MSLQKPLFSLIQIIILLTLLLVSGCQNTEAVPTTVPSAGETAVPAEPSSTTAPAATPTTAPLPELTFAVQATAPIPANGEAVTNEAGVTVQIGPDVLAEGVTAELSTWEIDPSWRQALEQAYAIDAPFVSLAVADVNDSQGRAVLRLPAASADSRLVAIIDNTYLAILDTLPQDGFLETAVRLGPTNSDAMEQVGSLTPGGSLQYTVLTPLATASVKSHLSKPAMANGRSCGIDMDPNFGRITHCRKSGDGKVQVTFLWGIDFSDDDGDQLADAIAAAMTRYGDELGFTAAKLIPQSPMQVVVETRSGDPRYKSLNGVIYLPVDAAKGMVGGDTYDTLHEMAHWIQDEEYNMAWAYWSGGKTWWLETAAENMVMLHDPAYIPQNLTAYGPVTAGNQLALQMSPYQWPGDLYVQAQLVKLNMCDDTAVCPLSEKSFIAAINAGTYPYDDAGAQGKLSANLDAYAQYLLGAAPGSGNTAMPLGDPVASGGGYGEFVEIRQTTKSDYDLVFPAESAQMKKGSDALGETIQVSAALQKDGVYPLKVSSGFDGRNPGLPVKLTIQPGAPFWYRVGNDAPQFNDGSQELVLQPIHLTMGLPGVRLVALGKADGETFQATVSQIDLQGTWLILPGEPVSDNIVCQDASAASESESVTIHASKELPISLPTIIGVMGDFRPDAAGNGLTWEWNDGRIPGDAAAEIHSLLQFSGAALPTVDKVQVQMETEWQRATSQASAQPQWPPLILGLAMVVPGMWSWRKGKKPYAILPLFLAVFLLVGCFGFGLDMWGTVKTDMQLTELEYLGGETIPTVGLDSLPTDTPLWKLHGTAVYDVSFYYAATEESQDAAVATCTGTATYNVEVQIFKDIVLNLDQ